MHVAEAQGVVAAETIGNAETQTLGDYRNMPRATFCNPQVASFGLTEQQARDDTVTATRRFARRQRSWFARDDRIHWLDPRSDSLVDDALRTIGL